MGVMDKFLNAMRLNSDEDEFYDDDFFDEDEEEDADDLPPRKLSRRDRKKAVEEEPAAPAKEEQKTTARPAFTSSKVTPMRQSRRQAQTSGRSMMEVCVIKPISVEDAHEITETLLLNRTVVLNLEGLDLEIAQRIIDFTSGSCYAISGNLQKISNFIFLVTPPTVDISGDFQDLMGSAFDSSSLQTDI